MLNVWIRVNIELENSLLTCPSPSAAVWDQAVALYTGSVASHTSGKNGFLLYSLAQVECGYFGTCTGGETAQVNQEIFANFVAGQQDMLQGDCNALEERILRIRSLLIIPLVQGILRMAYALDVQGTTGTSVQCTAGQSGGQGSCRWIGYLGQL